MRLLISNDAHNILLRLLLMTSASIILTTVCSGQHLSRMLGASNAMRYGQTPATIVQPYILQTLFAPQNLMNTLSLERVIEIASAANGVAAQHRPEAVSSLHLTRAKSNQPAFNYMISDKYHNDQDEMDTSFLKDHLTLTNDDKSLLDEFYNKDAKVRDQQSNAIDKLFFEIADQSLKGADILADSSSNRHQTREVSAAKSGWDFDLSLARDASNSDVLQSTTINKLGVDNSAAKTSAHYSPQDKLLTSYDPLHSIAGGLAGTQITGSTHTGSPSDQTGSTTVSAPISTNTQESTVDAIKMHNELLNKPPNDGKVRVRMYYHRAIHDDPRLYGTGPWKYWGHGWGMEFGYDPRSSNPTKEFFEKGYSIERAFGRDFCKDPKVACRHSPTSHHQHQHHHQET